MKIEEFDLQPSTQSLSQIYGDSLTIYEKLCFTLAKLKECVDVINSNDSTINDYIVAYDDLHNFVDTYFNKLNVQNEINIKINSLVADNTIKNIINSQLFTEINNSIANKANNSLLLTTIDTLSTKANQSDINALTSQLTNIIANNGNGTTPTEVVALRTSVNGEIFGSANNRIDNIEKSIDNTFNNFSKLSGIIKKISLFSIEGKTPIVDGGAYFISVINGQSGTKYFTISSDTGEVGTYYTSSSGIENISADIADLIHIECIIDWTKAPITNTTFNSGENQINTSNIHNYIYSNNLVSGLYVVSAGFINYNVNTHMVTIPSFFRIFSKTKMIFSTNTEINVDANAFNNGNPFVLVYHPITQLFQTVSAESYNNSDFIIATFWGDYSISNCGIKILRNGKENTVIDGTSIGDNTIPQSKLNFIINTSSRWKNENILIIGDSINDETYGADGLGYHKWSYFYQLNSGANITNDSIHATGFIADTTTEDKSKSLINRIHLYDTNIDYKLIVVALGINDNFQSIPIGNIDDSVHTTFYGATKYCLEYLRTNWIDAKIVVLLPMQFINCQTQANSQGRKLIDYISALKNVCNIYGMKTLNLYEDANFYPTSSAFRERWTLYANTGVAGEHVYDGVHPNEEFSQLKLEPIINAFLETV